jgi:exopolysaccharide biosynthesis polyprenyl glycosylphosphotransferase
MLAALGGRSPRGFMSKPQLINVPVGSGAETRGRDANAEARRRWLRSWRDPLRRRMLALADVLALVTGCLSLGVVFESDLEAAAWSLLFVPAWIVVAKLYGLYDRDHTALRHLTTDELPSIFLWALTAVAGTALALQGTPAGGLTFAEGARFWAATAGAAFAFRGLARLSWRRMTPPECALVVGEGSSAHATRRKLELFPDIHANAVDKEVATIDDLLRDYERVLALGIDRVIVADFIDESHIAEIVARCRRDGLKLTVVPPAQGMLGSAMRLSRVADLPVLEYNTWDVSRSTLLLKRGLDVAIASVALIVLSPLLLLIAMLIVLDSRGPVLFSQARAGVNGRPFRMLKFRTMTRDAEARLSHLVALDSLDEPMFKLQRDPRVTRSGRILRRASLDELPQFVNVLNGDMSLVGPRPEQIELTRRYTTDQSIRLAVKPGLTGPMQVYGRGELTFEERLAVEREYVENISVGRDIRILALTIAAVATGRGAY